jgi:tRNA(Ile)-lysidine synthase
MAGPDQPLTATAQVAASIARYRLLEPGCRVLAAVSGGRDSTALALLLTDLGYEVVVGHVDHRMRPGSEQDAAHCRRLADRIGAAFHALRLEAAPASEAGARGARYAALATMAERCDASRIATGHTLDDAAETVAMRLGRGGEPIGIPPKRGMVVRPLIELSRLDTGAVCRQAGTGWIDDPSNRDQRHRRNRLRRSAMPALATPEIRRLAVLGTAGAVRAQERRCEGEALAGTVLVLDGGRAVLDRAAIAALPRAQVCDVVRTALERLGIEAGQQVVRDVATKVVPVTGAGVDLPGGFRAWSDTRRIVLGPPQPAPLLGAVPLAVPGLTALPGWGLVALVEEADPSGPFPGPHGYEAVLDASAASRGLVLRQWRPGDRYRPLGAPGSTTLQDLFVNGRVPRQDRARVPVVATGNDIVWVAGFRIGQPWKVGPASTHAIGIRLMQQPS